MNYNKIIIGAGLYGLYAACLCAERGETVLIIECDNHPFARATYINQARVHNGYHYPRSYSTAIKSKQYFERFIKDFYFCIFNDFEQVYATSTNFSWTNAKQFDKFCKNAGIQCDGISTEKYFQQNLCDGAFITSEYTYDANILLNYYLKKLSILKNVKVELGTEVTSIKQTDNVYTIETNKGKVYTTPFLLNATYASTNQIIDMLGFEPFPIKYELCEIILCKVSENLKNVGITVMDGPFFSIMPFGKTGYHSLTSVTFTPHMTSYDSLPTFPCQAKSGKTCSPHKLANCNNCPAKPHTAWEYMSTLAKKYLKECYKFEYVESLFSVKPILKVSEIDDSRPTIINKFSENPTFISVLSGKINTVYDLNEVL